MSDEPQILDGPEIEQPILGDGKAIVDVDPKGYVKASAEKAFPGGKATVALEIDVILVLKELAKKTENTLDDSAIEVVAKALGR